MTGTQQTQVSEPRARDAVLAPAMNSGHGRIGEAGHSGRSAKRADDLIGERLHGCLYATFADDAQAGVCDIGSCDSRTGRHQRGMTPGEIKAELRRRGMSQRDLAEAIGMDENYLSKSLGKQGRGFTVREMDAIRAELAPEPMMEGGVALRAIPLLGDVPAGSFQPSDQRTGRFVSVGDDTPPRAYALRVKGDSMDLVIDPNDTIVIDPDDHALWPGERYIIRSADGETTFKEYQEGPARLVPLSSNPDHREIPLGKEPVDVLGKVVGYIMKKPPKRAS